jgi:hypothetical protein
LGRPPPPDLFFVLRPHFFFFFFFAWFGLNYHSPISASQVDGTLRV